jgi:hypothetical protein
MGLNLRRDEGQLVMRRALRAARIVLIPLAIVVGVLLLLLAHDVRTWQSSLKDQTLAYEAVPIAPNLKTPSTILPSGVSGTLLSVRRTQQWLKALTAFSAAERATSKLLVLGPSSYVALRRGAAALGPVTEDPNPVRASQAYNLLAAIEFREAIPGSAVVQPLADKTLSDLENAIRLDPNNEEARENMELVVRYLTVAIPPDQRQTRGLGKHANLYPKGGYAGPPGEGY